MSPLEGRKSGSGAPAQASTRTSSRSASSARRLRRTTGSPSRSSANAGVKCQPVRWTWDCASRSAAAIDGSACTPSIRMSTAFPARGGKSPPAQPPTGGSSARVQPIRPRRRRWWRQICWLTCSPNQHSTGKSARLTGCSTALEPFAFKSAGSARRSGSRARTRSGLPRRHRAETARTSCARASPARRRARRPCSG